MPSFLLGLSSTYFASKGIPIYDSVAKVRESGFNTVELGAGHSFEENVWETVKRIKRDFPEMHYTVHGLFPPQRERFWFNASLGLTKQNKAVIENLFRAAEIVEALAIGIHPGFANELLWGREVHGVNLGKEGSPLPREQSLQNLSKVAGFALKLSTQTGISFAIENTPGERITPLLRKPQDFAPFFEKCPGLGFLFDYGHALLEENIESWQQFFPRVCEVHLHYSRGPDESVDMPDHLPFPKRFNFALLNKIPNLRKMPLIFEHLANVSIEEIEREKQELIAFLSL